LFGTQTILPLRPPKYAEHNVKQVFKLFAKNNINVGAFHSTGESHGLQTVYFG